MNNYMVLVKKLISAFLVFGVCLQFFGLINVNAQCTIISSPSNLKPEDPIQTLEVKIATSNGLFSDTERDVWLDIGPMAWKLEGGFPRGSIRSFKIDSSKMQVNSGFSEENIQLFVGDIRFIRVEKKGIALSDLPPITPELIALQPIGRKIGGITNAPDSLVEITIPGGVPTPQNLLAESRRIYLLYS